jgi:hypothetical protein
MHPLVSSNLVLYGLSKLFCIRCARVSNGLTSIGLRNLFRRQKLRPMYKTGRKLDLPESEFFFPFSERSIFDFDART